MKLSMKGLLLLILLSVCSQAKGYKIAPKVDERIELISIAFRLAGAEEYSSNLFPKYIGQIEKHYGAYRNHDLIKYIKSIRETHGIAYDAVTSYAVNISEPPNMKPLFSFSKKVPDDRWESETARAFLKLLNKFYHDTDSRKFFIKQAELYRKTEQSFENVIEDLNHQWYENFYGQKPNGEYRVINAVGVGGNNYGAKVMLPSGKELNYAIIGTSKFDSLSNPEFDRRRYFPLVLHEHNHSFVNHLVEKLRSELQESGVAIYRPLKSNMRKQAYANWQTMVSESLVRAAVIRYMVDNNSTKETIDSEIEEQLQRGFLWTEDLVKEFERYQNNRNKYPTMESFMPEIVKFFVQTALKIDILKSDFDNKVPKVISLYPLINNVMNVDPNIKAITVNFNQELKGTGYSINYGEKGKKAYPSIGAVAYSENNKSFTFEVSLESDKAYQLVLTGLAFQSKEGYALEDYEINFRTKKN